MSNLQPTSQRLTWYDRGRPYKLSIRSMATLIELFAMGVPVKRLAFLFECHEKTVYNTIELYFTKPEYGLSIMSGV